MAPLADDGVPGFLQSEVAPRGARLEQPRAHRPCERRLEVLGELAVPRHVVRREEAKANPSSGLGVPTMVRPVSPHFGIRRIGPGVFAAVATPEGYGMCNSGIVDLGGETVVFDSMLTPTAGADLATAAARLTGRRPGFVINSHWHGDHIWGNSEFRGAHVVSSRTTRANILKLSPKQKRSDRREMRRALPHLDDPGSTIAPSDRPKVRAWFRGVLEIPRAHRIVAPDVTFGDHLDLVGTRRTLSVLTYGGGHTSSDVFAWLPDDGVLFAGDLVLRGFHLSAGGGWPDAWIKILQGIESLHPDLVVPGHGPPGDRSTLPENRGYLESVRRTARDALRRKLSRAQLLRSPVPRRYQGWGFSFMYPENLDRTARLARGPGKSRPG